MQRELRGGMEVGPVWWNELPRCSPSLRIRERERERGTVVSRIDPKEGRERSPAGGDGLREEGREGEVELELGDERASLDDPFFLQADTFGSSTDFVHVSLRSSNR